MGVAGISRMSMLDTVCWSQNNAKWANKSGQFHSAQVNRQADKLAKNLTNLDGRYSPVGGAKSSVTTCSQFESIKVTTALPHPCIHLSISSSHSVWLVCVWLAISKNKTKFSIIQKSISCVYWSVCLPLDCGFRLFHLLSLIPQTSFAWSSRLDASRMEWSGAAWIAATDVRVAVASSSGFNLERWALNAAPKAQVARSRSKYKKWVEWVMPCDSQNEGKHTELEHCWRAKKGVKFKLNISKN